MADVRLPNPGEQYDQSAEQVRNDVIEQELEDRWFRFEDIDLGPSTSRIILTSPNGVRYILGVDDAGTLTTTPA